jgi:hypothetical protein
VADVEVKLGPEWQAAIEYLGALAKKLPLTLQQAILQEAHFLRKEIVQGLDSGAPAGKAFKPHSALTRILRARSKRGSKILIASAGLRGGVRVILLPGGGAFVGVHRSVRTKDGKSLVRIAEIQEQGRSWEASPRQRRWLIMQLLRAGITPRGGSGGGTRMTIRIPARPFIAPILAEHGTPEKIRERMLERLKAAL